MTRIKTANSAALFSVISGQKWIKLNRKDRQQSTALDKSLQFEMMPTQRWEVENCVKIVDFLASHEIYGTDQSNVWVDFLNISLGPNVWYTFGRELLSKLGHYVMKSKKDNTAVNIRQSSGSITRKQSFTMGHFPIHKCRCARLLVGPFSALVGCLSCCWCCRSQRNKIWINGWEFNNFNYQYWAMATPWLTAVWVNI